MARALYRKYRSKNLKEVVGQRHITDILERSLKQKRTAHAYLFTGPRGVGKTSVARIMAHAISELPYDENAPQLDIIEIDAASNNGVDDIRELREKVQSLPVSGKKKVYIIDEVHMLSKPAFNALLKTLEEPPEHAAFIFATTNEEKLPPTIISRTQRFVFRTIPADEVSSHLRMIADKEKIKIDDVALSIIASRGEGSFRDSISLLDQLSSLATDKSGITGKLVENTLGLAPQESIKKLLASIESRDTESIITILEQVNSSGIQPAVFTTQLVGEIRLLLAGQPELAVLLDELLEVSRSHHPALKLLAVLVRYASPKKPSKSAALSYNPPAISAPIKELEKQAVKSKPKEINKQVATEPAAQKPKAASSKNSRTKSNTNQNLGKSLDWDKLIEYTRANHVAVFSVLSKCVHENTNGKLTLYTKNAFYKKKLDDVKYRAILSQCLQEVGADDMEIETIPSGPPPKDTTAAAVAAIMGGGEEVNVS